MNIYYTIASKQDDAQFDPKKSLGGFKSSTEPLNDNLGSLFDEISTMTIRNDKSEYIALMVRNELGINLTNVNVWIETNEGCWCAFEIAGVIPTVNASGQPVMERRRSRYDKPYIAEFEEGSLLNPLVVGNLGDGDTIGLWIKRSLKQEVIKADIENVYEPTSENANVYQSVVKETSDTVTLKISWD